MHIGYANFIFPLQQSTSKKSVSSIKAVKVRELGVVYFSIYVRRLASDRCIVRWSSERLRVLGIFILNLQFATFITALGSSGLDLQFLYFVLELCCYINF